MTRINWLQFSSYLSMSQVIFRSSGSKRVHSKPTKNIFDDYTRTAYWICSSCFVGRSFISFTNLHSLEWWLSATHVRSYWQVCVFIGQGSDTENILCRFYFLWFKLTQNFTHHQSLHQRNPLWVKPFLTLLVRL